VFQDVDQLVPQNFTEKELKIIYDIYWKKKKYVQQENVQYFDFRELEHVYNIFQLYYELDLTDEEENELYDQNTGGLMRALKFYVKMADLNEV
jgi:hypothetical protein